ncbi:MAG: PD-(D/E)XK nuclease family protein [Planctomycetaceae bacterium]|nr:PD-(D/E)XK nuclease family protein [Planctomycetaceae bacterium]
MAQQPTFDLALLSHSRLNCWLTCPKQFYFAYIKEIPEQESSLPLLFGTAIHEAVTEFLGSLKKEPLTEAEVHGVFHRALTDQLEFAEVSGCPVRWINATQEETIALGELMLTAFLVQVDRNITVVGTEVAFEFELGPGQIMRGGIDVILKDGEGKYRVIDLKTSAKAYNEDSLKYDMQPTIYCEAIRKLYPDAREVSFEYWVLTKTKEPKFLVYPLTRGEREARELRELAEEYQISVLAEVFPRKRDWQCRWCSYQNICDNGEADKTLTTERTETTEGEAATALLAP